MFHLPNPHKIQKYSVYWTLYVVNEANACSPNKKTKNPTKHTNIKTLELQLVIC